MNNNKEVLMKNIIKTSSVSVPFVLWVRLKRVMRYMLMCLMPKWYYTSIINELFYNREHQRYLNAEEFLRYEYSIYVERFDTVFRIFNFTFGSVRRRWIEIPIYKLNPEQKEVLEMYDDLCSSVRCLGYRGSHIAASEAYNTIVSKEQILLKKTTYFYHYVLCNKHRGEAESHLLPIVMLTEDQRDVLDTILASR